MRVAGFVLPILILVALAIGVLVYFLCYKAAINRKLRGEESGAHVPMASTETVWKVVAVIAVFVMYSSLSSKITNLQNDVTNLRSALGDKTGQLRYELDELEQTMKREASMISEVFYDFGEVDPTEHTTEMKFRVVPKSYSAETELSLNYRGETIVLTNNGDGIFTGSTVLPIFQEYYEDALIYITEGGVTKTEMCEELPKDYLHYYCLPMFYIMNCTTGTQEKKDSVSIELYLQMMAKGDDSEQFRDMTLYVEKDDTVIDEMPLADGAVSLDKSYPVKDGDSLVFYVRGVDAYGYIHEEYVFGWSTDGRSAEVGYEETAYPFRVYAPEGTPMTE